MKTQELHLYLDEESIKKDKCVELIYTDYMKTFAEVVNGKTIIKTTIPHFLNFRNAERLFVHIGDKVYEITLGECNGTNRKIKESHNIEKMMFSGEFDWL